MMQKESGIAMLNSDRQQIDYQELTL